MIDITLTPELIREGYVREIISKVQTMRKEAGFEVTDHIGLSVSGNDKIEEIVRENEREIASEVLADLVRIGSVSGYEKEWDLNGQKAVLAVEKLA